jgi:hypothetical protein
MYNPIFEEEDRKTDLKQLREMIYLRSTKDNFFDLISNIFSFVKKHPISFFTAFIIFSLGSRNK